MPDPLLGAREKACSLPVGESSASKEGNSPAHGYMSLGRREQGGVQRPVEPSPLLCRLVSPSIAHDEEVVPVCSTCTKSLTSSDMLYAADVPPARLCNSISVGASIRHLRNHSPWLGEGCQKANVVSKEAGRLL